ncbi:MAG: hypothetical protein AABW64_01790 [Nanoarchaeota archaeon]
MKSDECIAKLRELRKAVFTLNDMAVITQKEKNYLRVYLFRLKKKGKIKEVERGKYALQQHPFITASNMVFPAYISFLSAYSYYQTTTQIPNSIYIITHSSKKAVFLENYRIQFIKLPAYRLFGYHREKFMEKDVFIADKEKAIVDSLYLPEYCPLDETYTALGEELDISKLVSYALRMRSKVLLKRLGYLLELRRIDIYTQVKKQLNQRYDLLNPFQKRRKQKSKKWKLIINEVFEDVN